MQSSIGNNNGIPASEEILWTGKPIRHKSFTPLDIALFITGVILIYVGVRFDNIAIANFIYFDSVSQIGIRIILSLSIGFMIIMQIFGLYFGAIRHLVKAVIKHKTEYIITDRRIIIHTRGLHNITRSNEFRLLPCIDIFRGNNGMATLYFGVKHHSSILLDYLLLEIPWIYTRSKKYILFDVENSDNVMDILKRNGLDVILWR